MGLRRQVQLSHGGNLRYRWAPVALMAASGFAGLGYQSVWTQQGALWLGHEAAAVLAVVAAFFGGLAVGALLLGARIESSPRPLRWYAGCELTLALWSLLLVVAMPPFGAWLVRLTGAQPAPAWQWAVAFCGTFLLLLPATAAMGATLPAMNRISLRRPSQSTAALYASNTFGAVLGVLGVTFWLVPALGFARSALVCVVLNVLCGVAALAVFPASSQVSPSPPAVARSSVRSVLVRLALTGLLGIGYEVLVVRVLSQVTEGTIFTFALLLAVYLVGSAAGAAGYQRFLSQYRQQDQLSPALLAALSTACLLGTASLWGAELLRGWAQQAFGASALAAILAEAVPALLAFGLPTLLMGAVFSHLACQAQGAGIGFGQALGVNTLGAATAPAVFGVLGLPLLGAKASLLLVSVGYLGLVGRRSWSRPLAWLPAGAALALTLFAPPLAFVDLPEGARLVSYEDGVMAAVSVVEDAHGVARLRIDNRAQEGSSGTQRVDGRQAWLPLLLHPAPQHALFLGLGTGVTAASAAEDATLEVDAVELLPEVLRASAFFASSVADGAAFPRLHLRAGDARRYVRASQQSYDVIVADNFHPARGGSGSLYTVEHFEAVQERLAAHGVFCQWLPLHQLDRETLRSIVGAFLSVYPRGWGLLASGSLETPVLGLVGRRDDNRFDPDALHDRFLHVALPERVASIGLEDDLAVLGSFIAGPASLARFANGAPVNTDDRPRVAYLAPRITYAPDSSPGERLLALLRELSLEPQELLLPGHDSTRHGQLAAYWTARDRFIEAGRDVRASSKVEEVLAQVRDPLLSVLQISPDFRPAYDPLLAMATALARSDADAARRLVRELMRLQPSRTEASQLLVLLGDQPPVVDASRR